MRSGGREVGRSGGRRVAGPLALLALALLATALAAELPSSEPAPAEAPPTAPPIAVSLTIEIAEVRRALGPDLSRAALEAAADAVAKPRARFDAWLCASMRAGTGLVDSCPAGGAILSGPVGTPLCTIHAASTGPLTPHTSRLAPLLALSAVESLNATAYLDGDTLRALRDRGEVELRLAPAARALERLGLAGADVAEATVDAADGGRARLRVTRGRDRLGVRWAPVNASGATTASASVAPPPDLPGTPRPAPGAAGANAEPVLARVDIPIGVPMWRVFEARIPGNVGLGRPPISMAILVRRSGIQVRVRHFSEAAVLNLDSNLATGLSVLKVATAFKRRGDIDQVFEYLFRAPRRQEGDELVIEGPWPPDLKNGIAQALEGAVQQDASPRLAAALCRVRRLSLERALASWETERGASLSGALDRLTAEGYVDKIPTCPDGGLLSVDDGVVTCRAHL